MNQKTVCQLDSSGYFIGVTVADESPLEPGVFLIPAGCVEKPIPSVPEGSRAKWDGEDFVLEIIPVDPPPPEPSISDRRALVWSGVKTERTRRENGGVQVSGHWFQTDSDSRIKFLRLDGKAAALLAGGGVASDVLTVAGQVLHWKTAENGLVPMTAGMAQAIASAVENLDAAAFTRAEILRAQIAASSNPEGIDITTGWPAILEG